MRHTKLAESEISDLFDGMVSFCNDSETRLVQEEDSDLEEIVFDNGFSFPISWKDFSRFHANQMIVKEVKWRDLFLN